MRKEVDGEYGKSAFIETRAERIVPMTRRLARPYFRVGFILVDGLPFACRVVGLVC